MSNPTTAVKPPPNPVQDALNKAISQLYTAAKFVVSSSKRHGLR